MSNEVKTKEKVNMDPKYIIKLTVTLLGTCLIVALLLGLVNGVTAGPIAEINQQKTEARSPGKRPWPLCRRSLRPTISPTLWS